MEFTVAQNGPSCHIRLGPLFFPLDLTPLPDVAMELAQAARVVSITLKNVDNGDQGEKSGFIIASFASVETANHCFKMIEAMIASSDRQWKLEQIPVNDISGVTSSQDVLGEPLSETTVVCNGEQQPEDGYVLVGGLLPSVDEQTLADIFGASDVVGIKFTHEPGQLLKSAIVQFKAKDSAKAAIASYEGYELDDGATKTCISMQLLQGSATSANTNPPSLDTNADEEDQIEKPSNGHVELGCENVEQTPEQICASIRELMIVERTNWAELAGVEDLWLLLDKVVQTIGWQPEETLKEAMMTTLQAALADCQYEWLAEHLKMLQRRWAKEADNPDKSKIRRRLLLVNAEGRSIPGHDHVPPHTKKFRKRNNKQTIALMGIGGVLSKMKSQSEQAANSKNNLPVDKGKKKTTSEQRSSTKRRKREQSSSESGEASSTSSPPSSLSDEDEEREEGEYYKSKTRRHRTNSDGSKSKNTTNSRRSKQIDPEWTQSILEQVIPHMFRMMPKLIEWMNVNNSSSSMDAQFRPETVNMTQNFSNPPMMPLPMNNYTYRAPSVPVGPPYAPMVANLNVPPPANVSQPLYGVHSSAYNSYGGTTLRMPFAPAPPPPPNRQY